MGNRLVDGNEPQDLQFVIGVLADLGGQPAGEGDGMPEAVDLSLDSLDAFIAAQAPALSFSAPDTLLGEGERRVVLRLQSMRDFQPEHVVASHPVLHKLHEYRTALAAFRDELLNDPQARPKLDQFFHDLRAAHGAAVGAPPPAERPDSVSDGAGLPLPDRADDRARAGAVEVWATSGGVWSTRARTALDVALDATPARHAEDERSRQPPPPAPNRLSDSQRTVQDTVLEFAARPDAYGSDILNIITPRISELDRVISTQRDAIFRAEPFQALQAVWRGLEKLLESAQEFPPARVRVWASSREALQQQLDDTDSAGSLQRSFGLDPGSGVCEPVGLLLIGHAFDAEDLEAAFVQALAGFAATLQAPGLADAAQDLQQEQALRQWVGLTSPSDWPTMLGACRIGHHLRLVLKQRHGHLQDAEACAALVRECLEPFVATDGLPAIDAARFPLRQADVTAAADVAGGMRIEVSVVLRHGHARAAPVTLILMLLADGSVSLLLKA